MPASAAARTGVGAMLRIASAVDRESHYTFAKLGERYSCCRRRLRNETELGHSRSGVCLQTEETTFRLHSEVDPSIAAQFECIECKQSQALDFSSQVRGKIGWEHLAGHACCVF